MTHCIYVMKISNKLPNIYSKMNISSKDESLEVFIMRTCSKYCEINLKTHNEMLKYDV